MGVKESIGVAVVFVGVTVGMVDKALVDVVGNLDSSVTVVPEVAVVGMESSWSSSLWDGRPSVAVAVAVEGLPVGIETEIECGSQRNPT
jgi:hypothetical protein